MNRYQKEMAEGMNKPQTHTIANAFSSFGARTLYEVQAGGGKNIANLVFRYKDTNIDGSYFKGIQAGGCDTRPEAVEHLRTSFEGGRFEVGKGDNMFMSDKSVEIIIAEGVLMKERNIGKYLKEFKRVAREGILLVEPYHRNLLKRLEFKLKTGYNMHDYKHLLEKYGYYDIDMYELPRALWSEPPWCEHGYIILAKTLRK